MGRGGLRVGGREEGGFESWGIVEKEEGVGAESWGKREREKGREIRGSYLLTRFYAFFWNEGFHVVV